MRRLDSRLRGNDTVVIHRPVDTSHLNEAGPQHVRMLNASTRGFDVKALGMQLSAKIPEA